MRKYLFILPFLFFLFSSFSVSDSHAASDISRTFSSGTSVTFYDEIFPTCTDTCLNDYSYLIIDGPLSTWSYSSLRVYLRYDGSNQVNFMLTIGPSFSIYKLPFDGNRYNFLQFGQNFTFSSDVTFTLTESYQSGITPSGSLSVTENGSYDVTDYAEVVVDIPATDCPPSSGGNYHDDLMKIYNAIILCAGTVLVLYFFYCIYRMFIKSTWGKQ